MDRVDLHCLVDTLPEGAFENAKRMLEHLQVFPPKRSTEMERMRQIRLEQMGMRQSIRPGTMGGGGGGGSFNPTLASRSNRSPNPSFEIFSATVRFSRVSRAR
jgi:hypothetical protein